MSKLKWKKLLSEVRRKDLDAQPSKKTKSNAGARTEIERDYDRILFSTPVRRLSDKTQVFPLDKNDSVRTRLTHSHEVSNLARSLGVALCYDTTLFNDVDNANRNIPSMLAAVGLAHDIGNPPFGHQGEKSIASWFKKNEKKVFEKSANITPQMRQDYLNFEGNAQALRILTKLQILNDQHGLNLTCGSLAALMKYPTSSDQTSDKTVTKKFGHFLSEASICQTIWEQTGLKRGIRHPLAYLMEASDDIAYAVLDAEDAIKKKLVSFRDLTSFLEGYDDKDPVIQSVKKNAEDKALEFKDAPLSSSERNDLSMQMLRVYAIGALVIAVKKTFEEHYDAIMSGQFKDDLIGAGEGKSLCKALKEFARKHAFNHRSVLELELKGHKVIHSIMDMLWPAIVSRKDPLKVKKHEGNPFQQYAYGLISENYKRIFEDQNNKLPLSYKRAQLLADMIAGMTDTFAIDFERNLSNYKLD